MEGRRQRRYSGKKEEGVTDGESGQRKGWMEIREEMIFIHFHQLALAGVMGT